MAEDKYEFFILRINAYATPEEKEAILNAEGDKSWVLWSVMRVGRNFEYYFSRKK